ncbi:MAG: DUF1579 domain-containing protein [bacterium]|nr:DUF1579 domain-containing protein [bacterium]
MHSWMLSVAVVVALVPFAFQDPQGAGSKAPSGRQDPAVRPEALEHAARLARPAPMHERLQRLVGTWDLEVRSTPRGGEARDELGSVVGKAILGGRYVVLNYKLVLRGLPFEGVQILGYDTLAQQVTSSWRDDHSTWSVECAGRVDEAMPERLQLRGRLRDARDPMGRDFRIALTLPEDDGGRVVMSMHDTFDNREHLVQTQEWTRRE